MAKQLLMSILVSTVVWLVLASATIVVIVEFGLGRNQAVMPLEVYLSSRRGMSLEEFCRKLGINKPARLDNGRFQVSEIGFLYLFTPQHEIFADFNENGNLVDVYVLTYMFGDEFGAKLPLEELEIPQE